MNHIKVNPMLAKRILSLRGFGYSQLEIAEEVGLSPGYVGDLFRQGALLERIKNSLFKDEPVHPGRWPCMLKEKEWPRCLHGDHCYLSCRCGAWANQRENERAK